MANTAKTAIITGASQGIGAGLVEAFLKRGYNIVANSRAITKANPFVGKENVALVDGDISLPSTAAAIVDTAISRFGRQHSRGCEDDSERNACKRAIHCYLQFVGMKE